MSDTFDPRADEIPAPKKSKPKVKPEVKPELVALKRTTDDWPLALGLFTQGPKMGKLLRTKHPSWQHNAAAALHGWQQHKHDAAEALSLTEADYRAALKAVEGAPPLQPHKAALSQHCKHNFSKAKG